MTKRSLPRWGAMPSPEWTMAAIYQDGMLATPVEDRVALRTGL